MFQVRLQRDSLQEGGQTGLPDDDLRHDAEASGSLLSKLLPATQKLIWLIGGMALGAMSVIMVWWGVLLFMGDGVSQDYKAGSLPKIRRQLVMLPPQSASIEEISEDLVNLTENLQTLNASVDDLRLKLQGIHTVTDSIASLDAMPARTVRRQQDKGSDTLSMLEALPSPAVGVVGASTPDNRDAGKSGGNTSSTLSASKAHVSAAAEIRRQETGRNTGPWIINIASFPKKEDAEQFIEKTRSRGVEGGLYPATVRGKNYWRVHVAGFSTLSEANARASLIKEQLGIKDLWVAKR